MFRSKSRVSLTIMTIKKNFKICLCFQQFVYFQISRKFSEDVEEIRKEISGYFDYIPLYFLPQLNSSVTHQIAQLDMSIISLSRRCFSGSTNKDTCSNFF